jgi:hypothetical protein
MAGKYCLCEQGYRLCNPPCSNRGIALLKKAKSGAAKNLQYGEKKQQMQI